MIYMRHYDANTRLYDTLVTLKRHLRSCRYCGAALKANDPMAMCGAGMLLTLDAAKGYDSVVRLRIKAHSDPAGTVFACPDLSKHGKVYALTAPALLVTGVQDTIL